MNPHVAALVEIINKIVKAVGIRLAVVFVLVIVLWNPAPPGTTPRNTMITLRFLTCFVGAVIPHWWKVRAFRWRAIRLLIFFLLTLGTYVVYRYAVVPSKPATSSFFLVTAYVFYILNSFCYGFCGGEVASVFEAQVAKAETKH